MWPRLTCGARRAPGCASNSGCRNRPTPSCIGGLYRRLRWFDSATGLSWNVRFLIDQGTPRDCADLIDSEAATAWSSGRETAHDQRGPWHLPSAAPVRTIQSAPAGPFASDHQKRAGVNRDALCLGLGSIEHFMCGSECRTRASLATSRHASQPPRFELRHSRLVGGLRRGSASRPL
jgi:hypothetical protein